MALDNKINNRKLCVVVGGYQTRDTVVWGFPSILDDLQFASL